MESLGFGGIMLLGLLNLLVLHPFGEIRHPIHMETRIGIRFTHSHCLQNLGKLGIRKRIRPTFNPGFNVVSQAMHAPNSMNFEL